MEHLWAAWALFVPLFVSATPFAWERQPKRRDEGEGERDLEALQGRWRRPASGQEKSRGISAYTKEIKSRWETVTAYGEAGEVVHAHTAEIKVRQQSGIGMMLCRNLEVTAGAKKGQKLPGPMAYIYRADKDRLYEVWGIMPGQQETPVNVMTWSRAPGR